MYWVLIVLAALCAVLGYAGYYFALYPPDDEMKQRALQLFLPLCFFFLALLSVVLARVVRGLDAGLGDGRRPADEQKAPPAQESAKPPAK